MVIAYISHILEKISKVNPRILEGIQHYVKNTLSCLLQPKICESLTLKRLGAIMGAIAPDSICPWNIRRWTSGYMCL